MKWRSFFPLIFSFLSFSVLIFAQPLHQNFGRALASGSVAQMAPYLGDAVSLTLKSRQGMYSRSQAAMILKDFFEENTVSGFKELKSGGDTHTGFVIGELNTRHGVFQVYFTIQQHGNSVLVQELQITP